MTKKSRRHGSTTMVAAMFMAILSVAVNGQDLAADTRALLVFSSVHDPRGRLKWSNATATCTWKGITCVEDRVHEVRLPGKGFRGVIPPGSLGSLTELRVVSLRNNRLTGVLPGELGGCNQLQSLYLANNLFSGPVLSLTGLWPHLQRLSLENNRLNGTIPASLGQFPELFLLALNNNSFSGSIPSFNLPHLTVFNISNNNLSGPIPATLTRFPPTSYLGNPGLCGAPLTVCPYPVIPSPSPLGPSFTPSPSPLGPSFTPSSSSSSKNGLSKGAIVGIVVGGVAFLAVILTGLFFCLCRRKKEYQGSPKPEAMAGVMQDRAREKELEAAVPPITEEYYSASGEKLDRSKLVFFDGKRYTFDLEDLLRASAEVLGKGSVGTAYKAILEDGTIMAVKRLKDVVTGKKEFESQIQVVGKLQHRNIVPLRAYYFSTNEKLLVYDFMQMGSLSALLHGNLGGSRTPLDWATRVKIALGAARGLAYLHAQGGPRFVHGNIKSSNILLSRDLQACISDFGLAQLLASSSAQAKIIGYRAPEVAETRKVTQMSDVYSFGVLLLELLTGKAPKDEDGIDLPQWVQSVVKEEWTAEVFDLELLRYQNIEDEMVSMLKIAMQCVDPVPEKRLSMHSVLLLLEGLHPFSIASLGDDGDSMPRLSESAWDEKPRSSDRDKISQQQLTP